MRRLLLFIPALLILSSTSFAQYAQTHQKQTSAGLRASRQLDRPDGLPVQPLPSKRASETLRLLGYPGEGGVSPDSLSESEILRRISRIYRYQSDILVALAEEKTDQAERTLELAMSELGVLVAQPNIMDRPRFAELYRSIITEYESFYGTSPDALTNQYGDIFDLRAEMFAVLNDIENPLLEDVNRPAKLQPMETVVEMTYNRLVEQSIAYLLRTPEKHLYRWLSRSETYFPMIEQIFREEGLPDEIKYLAMIESGLNPQAVSWAHAVGMWQFIAATGRSYGLEVNTWVDERRDPEKATRAAARHLRDLYETFGDWHLAMAGYNCGAGNVSKALRRLGRQKASFWEIYPYLPRETRNYVPMFIAASLVASNPNAYNLARVEPGPKYDYHYVPVHGMISLDKIADLTGTDEATIKALNPELRRSSTPPTRGTYYVRIPLGTYDQFAEGYRKLPASEKRRTVSEYVVRRGDTVKKIANAHGVSTSELMSANGMRSSKLLAGQRLTIPVARYDESVPLPDLASASPVTVQYGIKNVRPITADASDRVSADRSEPEPPVVRTSDRPAARNSSTTSASSSSSSDTRVVYKVRRGDTLGNIASRYGVSIRNIQQWNNLRGTKIRSGQNLKLYPSGSRAAAVNTASSSSSTSQKVYRVRRGDTLTEIAARNGVSVNDLKKWNNLKSGHIQAGQRLKLYGSSAPAAKSVVYKVRRGDSLGKIASKYGVSVSDLKRWNNLRSSTIIPGQRLKINT